MNGLFSKTIGVLSDLVGARSQRHQVLASNVSNIDTPGYEPKDVDFENLIASMQGKGIRMARTNGKHLPAATPEEACPSRGRATRWTWTVRWFRLPKTISCTTPPSRCWRASSGHSRVPSGRASNEFHHLV
ncbi:MAG: flagellar basal body protein [Desulfobacterales bacterium]|nr:flagellar basal body protein [Desulfobacterales bacterium]